MAVVTYSAISGSQFQANTWTSGDQQSPDVLGLDNGGFVVGYLNSDTFELLDFYDAAGVTPGFVTPYANGTETDAAGAPSLTQLTNGNVVVVWDDNHAATPGIVATIFSQTGEELVSEFNVTAFTSDVIPQVAALTGGGFAVTFQFAENIFVEILNDAGVTVLDEFSITDATTLDSDPAIAGLADGGLVVVWTNDTGAGTDLRCSIYNANGTVRADNILLDGQGDNSQPSVVALPNGNFAVAYTDSGWTGTAETDITAGVWDENGSFVNWELVNFVDGSTSGDGVSESDPSITVLENGFIAVSYTDPFSLTDDDIRFGVLDQDANLLDVGATILDFSVQDDFLSSISGLNSGRFISVWQDTLSDGSGSRITGRTMEIVRTTTGDNTAEVLVGDELRDIMIGLGGADTLQGQAGNDTLQGGAGADALSGGLGTDTAVYEDSAVGVVVRLWNGTGQNGDAQGDTLSSVENVIGSGLSDSLIGADAIANRLEGGAGNDFLAGLSGNDVLEGGTGADQLDGGGGTDTASYTGSSGAVSVNLTFGIVSGSDAQGDTLMNIESIIGSSFADTLTGNSLGNGLSGEGGNDVLLGGAGGDVLNGGSGFDRADYQNSAAGGVVVRLWNGTGQNGDAQGDTLTGIESVTGTGFSDSLIGADAMTNSLEGGGGNDFLAGLGGDDLLLGQAGADTLDGGAGDDQLQPGEGADTLAGGAGTDTASYVNSAAGVVVRLWNGTGQNGEAQGDALNSIENVLGSALADSLIGADAIGNRLEGRGGNDFVVGLSGDDVLEGGAGADQLDGGAGTDTASYATSAGGVTVRLWNGTGQNGDAQGDALTSIENVTGSGMADSLIGANAIANRLEGGQGDDFLAGLSGDDVLNGGGGADELSGGLGDDTFVFRLFDGSDIVTDFLPGLVPNDVIQLVGWGSAFDTFGEVTAAASQVGANVVIDFGNGQTLSLLNVTLANLDAGDFFFT